VKEYWQGRVVIAQPNFSRLRLICPNGCPLPRFICSHRSGLRLEKLHCVPERYVQAFCFSYQKEMPASMLADILLHI